MGTYTDWMPFICLRSLLPEGAWRSSFLGLKPLQPQLAWGFWVQLSNKHWRFCDCLIPGISLPGATLTVVCTSVLWIANTSPTCCCRYFEAVGILWEKLNQPFPWIFYSVKNILQMSHLYTDISPGSTLFVWNCTVCLSRFSKPFCGALRFYKSIGFHNLEKP